LQLDEAGTSTILPNGQRFIISGANTAIGFEALQQNTIGSNNTAVGYNTLTYNLNGYQNTAVGQAALFLNTSGFYNTACGRGALSSEDGGIANAAVGADSFQNLMNGNQNAAVGAFSFQHLTSGTANIGLGYNAGQTLTSGNNNIYIGYSGNNSESGMIYIGDPTVQTDTYLAGNLHAPGGMILDSTGADTGTLSSAWSLTFGGAPPYTGEGIGSVRVSGQNDSYGLDFYTDFTKRLVIQNGGNVGIGTTSPSSLLTVAGQISCQSITITSDRNAKEDFAAVDPRSVLEKVSTLPVTQWRYKQDTNGFKHIGPMAQDFQAAFGLNGADDRHISVVDEGGVALAAIQGLNEKLEDTRAENAALKRQNDSLAKQLNDLARVVQSLADK
jgi:hypothetical protein